MKKKIKKQLSKSELAQRVLATPLSNKFPMDIVLIDRDGKPYVQKTVLCIEGDLSKTPQDRRDKMLKEARLSTQKGMNEENGGEGKCQDFLVMQLLERISDAGFEPRMAGIMALADGYLQEPEAVHARHRVDLPDVHQKTAGVTTIDYLFLWVAATHALPLIQKDLHPAVFVETMASIHLHPDGDVLVRVRLRFVMDDVHGAESKDRKLFFAFRFDTLDLALAFAFNTYRAAVYTGIAIGQAPTPCGFHVADRSKDQDGREQDWRKFMEEAGYTISPM